MVEVDCWKRWYPCSLVSHGFHDAFYYILLDFRTGGMSDRHVVASIAAIHTATPWARQLPREAIPLLTRSPSLAPLGRFLSFDLTTTYRWLDDHERLSYPDDTVVLTLSSFLL